MSNTLDKEKVMYDADDIVEYRTNIEGWVDKNGRFWGKDENMARYHICTHKTCECGTPMEKYYTICNTCRDKKSIEQYNEREYKDIEFPVYSHLLEEYFRDADELEDFLYDHNEDEKETYKDVADLIEYKDLRLVNCRMNYHHKVSYDSWGDELPEDGDLPKEFMEKIDEFNTFIETLPALSWSPGKYRTEYKG